MESPVDSYLTTSSSYLADDEMTTVEDGGSPVVHNQSATESMDQSATVNEEKMNNKMDEESVDDGVGHAEHKDNGNACYLKGDYRGAIAHYTLAIETARSDLNDELTDEETKELKTLLASYYSNRAAAFTMILKHDEAITDCDSAIEHNPDFFKAFTRKAKILTTKGDLDGALKTFSLALVRDPNNAKTIKDKDEVLEVKQRFQNATNLIKKHRDSGGTHPGAQRDAKQALALIEIILSPCRAWKEAMLLKVEALNNLARFEEAYALTTKLIRLGMGNQNTELVLLRAESLFAIGQIDDAITHLRQVIGFDPDHARAKVILRTLRTLAKKKAEGDVAYKARDFEKAMAEYSLALEMCPCPPRESASYRAKVLFNRASSHAALRNHNEVIDDCTEAIQLDNEYTKAYKRRAASLLIIGGKEECEKATRDYEKALKLAKTDEEKEDIEKKIRSAQVQLKRASRKDFYKILGVTRDATDAEIKKSYRKKALKWHPDRHGNSTEEQKKKAEETFRDVNLAYEVLSDPQKKQRYDEGVEEQDLDNPHARPGGHDMGGHGGIDPNVLFQMFMQQQGGMGGMGGSGRNSFHFG
mmetsp:Transcript_8069/g.10858  ORF Transcript_8069/g.10858 Transcript_8069/m.10858 type:complete len:586 (-) Transcript_8069:172-1929(-)